MIIDYVDKINLYPELQEYADMVHGFIQRVEKEKLLAGRYDLEKGVFASLQNYNIRPFAGAQMEFHNGQLPQRQPINFLISAYNILEITVFLVEFHLCTGGWTYAKHCCDRSGAGYEDRV